MHLSQFSCRIDWFRITFASADGMYENAPCFYINKLSAVKLMYVRLSMHLQATRCQAAVQQKNKAVDKHFKKRNRDLLFGDADGEDRGRTPQRRCQYAEGSKCQANEVN